MNATEDAAFDRIEPGGAREKRTRALAAEVPVAVEVNGIGYAVMMATPADLEDFAWGFADRSVRGWTWAAGVPAISIGEAIPNLNTPGDLARLDAD